MKGATFREFTIYTNSHISIHAPMKGATLPRIYDLHQFPYFNPRTHEGCDLSPLILSTLRQQFQSTHPRRVRLVNYAIENHVKGFQSTHPRRVRLYGFVEIFYRGVISIHAPTKGATNLVTNLRILLKFQSTHPRRVRQQSVCECDGSKDISIHAPTKGATLSK